MASSYSEFVGARLQLAREFRDLTQRELAIAVGVDPSMISLVEAGAKKPSSELALAFAACTGFAIGFFFLRIADPFVAHECHFRHRRNTPEHTKKRVRAHASLLAMVANALRTKFRFPEFNVPAIDTNEDFEIDQAADKCRSSWGLPLDQPIRDLARVLEHAGVMIMSHVGETRKIDAFSRFGQFSMIFLNTCRESASRRFFDIGHETGHLVLHRDRPTGDLQTEHEADRFAGAFLLPTQAFTADFQTERCTISHLLKLKLKWFVSGQAILKRAYELGLIEIDRFRSLQKQTSLQWRDGEPYEPDFVGGEIFNAALTRLCLRESGAFATLADRLQIEPHTLAEVTGFHPAALTNVLPFQ